MLVSHFFLLTLLVILHSQTSIVHAKCCREEVGGQCGDNSDATPCCGYKKCNAACCDCPGVQVIREVIELSTVTYTSVITAPLLGTAYETWTCRASHITTWLPYNPSTKAGEPAITFPTSVATVSLVTGAETISPTGTPPAFKRVADDGTLTDLRDILNQHSNGTKANGSSVLTLNQYMAFFQLDEADMRTRFAQSVRQKFHMHDRNGDGYLNLHEMRLLCDEDGCEEPTELVPYGADESSG